MCALLYNWFVANMPQPLFYERLITNICAAICIDKSTDKFTYTQMTSPYIYTACVYGTQYYW